MNQKGVTIVEVVTSLVIMAVAITGLSLTTAHLALVASRVEVRAQALQAVEDRISLVQMYPAYHQLDSVFSETDVVLPSLPQYVRTTTLTRIIEPGEKEGMYVDFTQITVTVDGPGLDGPISRTVAVGVS